MIGENSALGFFFLIHLITENAQLKHFHSSGYNGLHICVCVPRKNVHSKAHRLLAHNANVLL
jgi:hypothetical protein